MPDLRRQPHALEGIVIGYVIGIAALALVAFVGMVLYSEEDPTEILRKNPKGSGGKPPWAV